MSCFVYFVDGFINPINGAELDQFGLRYAFEGPIAQHVLTGRTPSGGTGKMLADADRLGAGNLSYHPDEQLWRKLPRPAEGPQVYVGCDRRQPPRPEALARQRMKPGEYVRFGDGHEWLVPRLRFWSGADGFRSTLPHTVDLDDDGQIVVGPVNPADRHLDAIAERLIEGMVFAEIGDAPRLTTGEAIEAVATLLAANYVVTLAELGERMLNVVHTDDALHAACRAAVDYDTAIAWSEKKSAEGSVG